MMSYNKVALWLQTLEGLVGVQVFDEAMRTFFERWKFKHPSGRDFVAVMNEVIIRRDPEKWPDGMDWFFEQVLEGTEECDFAVASIENIPVTAPTGFIRDTMDCVLPGAAAKGGEQEYQARVILHRLGGIRMPVDVAIVFDDGRRIMEYWDGADRSKDFTYTGHARIMSAEIDPDRKICLDLNYINNSMSVKPQKTGLRYYTSRTLSHVQHFMETLSLLM
jgi:hypothetical protein